MERRNLPRLRNNSLRFRHGDRLGRGRVCAFDNTRHFPPIIGTNAFARLPDRNMCATYKRETRRSKKRKSRGRERQRQQFFFSFSPFSFLFFFLFISQNSSHKREKKRDRQRLKGLIRATLFIVANAHACSRILTYIFRLSRHSRYAFWPESNRTQNVVPPHYRSSER